MVRGEVIGVFEVINVEDEKFFREKYLPHLAILADYVAIAVDNVRNLQKLQARTFIDEVTGFYNTRYLILSLDRLIPQIPDRGEHFSVVFLDLDNFKAVVDTHGHLLGSQGPGGGGPGDPLELGPEDSLVRYGGDEFIILLPHRSQSEALEVTRRLRQRAQPTPFLQDEGLDQAHRQLRHRHPAGRRPGPGEAAPDRRPGHVLQQRPGQGPHHAGPGPGGRVRGLALSRAAGVSPGLVEWRFLVDMASII